MSGSFITSEAGEDIATPLSYSKYMRPIGFGSCGAVLDFVRRRTYRNFKKWLQLDTSQTMPRILGE